MAAKTMSAQDMRNTTASYREKTISENQDKCSKQNAIKKLHLAYNIRKLNHIIRRSAEKGERGTTFAREFEKPISNLTIKTVSVCRSHAILGSFMLAGVISAICMLIAILGRNILGYGEDAWSFAHAAVGVLGAAVFLVSAISIAVMEFARSWTSDEIVFWLDDFTNEAEQVQQHLDELGYKVSTQWSKTSIIWMNKEEHSKVMQLEDVSQIQAYKSGVPLDDIIA